jgi:hypothetical protein
MRCFSLAAAFAMRLNWLCAYLTHRRGTRLITACATEP